MSYAAPLSPVSLARVRVRGSPVPLVLRYLPPPVALGPRNPFNLRAFCVVLRNTTSQGPSPDSQVSTERKRERERALREGSRELGQRTRAGNSATPRSKAFPATFPIQEDILQSPEKPEYLIVVNIYMYTRTFPEMPHRL